MGVINNVMRAMKIKIHSDAPTNGGQIFFYSSVVPKRTNALVKNFEVIDFNCQL